MLVVERSRKGSGKADCELHLTEPDCVYASMLFVVVDVVVVFVVLLLLLVKVVEEVFRVLIVVVVASLTFFVVTMLLIGAMSSRNGSSGAGVDIDAFLTEDSDDDVVTTDEVVVVEEPPINWSMAYHVKSWFLSGAFVEESSTATRGSMRSDWTERDWRETTLPLPRMMEGGTWGRGWRLSMKTLLVSLF